MNMHSIRDALLAQLEELSLDEQQVVLKFARSVAASHSVGVGTPGTNLLPLAGIMSDEDAEEMLRHIEEGCGQIDPSQW